MVPTMCKLYLQKFSFLFIHNLHNACLHIEDVHFLFCAHFINIFLLLRGVELRHFSFQDALIVSVLCNL